MQGLWQGTLFRSPAPLAAGFLLSPSGLVARNARGLSQNGYGNPVTLSLSFVFFSSLALCLSLLSTCESLSEDMDKFENQGLAARPSRKRP